jgi:pimeloyl-ACP methyl ester carboxylesterase
VIAFDPRGNGFVMTDGPESTPRLSMRITDIRTEGRCPDGYRPVTIVTDRGEVAGRHYAAPSSAAVILVGGAGGGWDTPARGLYPTLCQEFAAEGISSLRLRFREPSDLGESVLDVLAGITFFADSGDDAIGLIGHSFGGAVAIQAAAAMPLVRAVAALAIQRRGADPAADLAPRCALLLAHGLGDEVLSPDCSRAVFRIAGEPKRLELFPGAKHGLDEVAGEVRALVREWMIRHLSAAAAWPPPGIDLAEELADSGGAA